MPGEEEALRLNPQSLSNTQAVVLISQIQTPAFSGSQQKDPLRSPVVQGIQSSMTCIQPWQRGSRKERDRQKTQQQCNLWRKKRRNTIQKKSPCSRSFEEEAVPPTASQTELVSIQAVSCSSVTGMHQPVKYFTVSWKKKKNKRTNFDIQKSYRYQRVSICTGQNIQVDK